MLRMRAPVVHEPRGSPPGHFSVKTFFAAIESGNPKVGFLIYSSAKRLLGGVSGFGSPPAEPKPEQEPEPEPEPKPEPPPPQPLPT